MNTLPSLDIRVSSETHSLLQKTNDECEGAIVFFTSKDVLTKALPVTKAYADLDACFGNTVQLIVSETKAPSARVIIAPVGSIRGDFDDVRRYKDAAFAAGKRALKAGIRSPNVYFADVPGEANTAWTDAGNEYKHFIEVTLLGLLDATFEPIDVREHYERIKADVAEFKSITVFTEESCLSQKAVGDLLKRVEAIEIGRRLSIDIGSPDPERMSPANIAEYLQAAFKDDKNVKLTVIDDIAEIKKRYPLAHAVTRASLPVPRHHPRFVHFEYKSPDQAQVKENLYFVGKGVTYDTGGADIKCSGHMRAMSHDKCGAATVAGFMKTLSLLQPNKVNVRAGIALVRNSVGSDSYVSDEIIYSRNGTRVLVGNTDAEGRMVMTDLLCEFKEQVIAEKKDNAPASKAPSFLITVATLTGHALRAYDGYGIALDNGFSRRHKISKRIYEAGHLLADPFEISTFRREDVAVVQPGRSSEDVVQANDKASTATNRGHQYPAGFMLIASGLDKHGLDSELPIGFTHMDVAGSAETIDAVGWSIPRVTGSPVPALTGAFAL